MHNRPNADGDGIRDNEDLELGTDALNADTDGDGWSDADALLLWGTDPTDLNSKPGPRSAVGRPR